MPSVRKEYHSAAAVARRLGIHVNTMVRLLADGEFPDAYKIGRDWRIHDSEVVAFQEKQRQAARDERAKRSAGKQAPSSAVS